MENLSELMLKQPRDCNKISGETIRVFPNQDKLVDMLMAIDSCIVMQMNWSLGPSQSTIVNGIVHNLINTTQ